MADRDTIIRDLISERIRLQGELDGVKEAITSLTRGRENSDPPAGETEREKAAASLVDRRPRRRGRPPGGSNTRASQAVELVGAAGSKGLSIPELADKMGIKQNYLYRVLPALEEQGKVSKGDDKRYRLAKK